MTRRILFLFLTLAIISLAMLAAAGYFTLQLQRSRPPQPANFLAAEKGYGVTVDLTQYDDATLPGTLAAMRRSGLVWLRQPVNWASTEPAPGQFNWANLDRVLAHVHPDHFKLIAVLQTTPDWARPAATVPTTPPAQLSDFGNFARAFAGRYGRQVDYYQIWHQPNLSTHWGDTFVDSAAYADLLREAALNIRDVDPTAHILTAALAATLEDGPLNLNELVYLEQLYQAKANRWFDIVAIQPYGLWTEPLDTPAPDTLNFRRAELVRQVMLRHNDTGTPVWATAFGWVALPANWSGQPSPWSNDLPAVQAPRTAIAIEHARASWPWLGPMLAARWDTAGLSPDDPARGFALTETAELQGVIQRAMTNSTVATVGRYPATHSSGQYSPGWRFALTHADIPRQEPRSLTIPFEGTRLDLDIKRGLFRGNLWVTVDGRPANALPQDGQGRSYVILYDPLRERDSVTVAEDLPPGRHTALIEANGGWEQWAIEGWTVYNGPGARRWQTGLFVAGLLAALSGAGLLWQLLRAPAQILKPAWGWSEIFIALFAIFGETGQVVITVGLAVAVYLAPGNLALALLMLLALAILLRPDLGLVVVTLATFFYQIPLRLPFISLSPVELSLALTVAGFLFRGLVTLGRARYAPENLDAAPPMQRSLSPHLSILPSLITNLRATDLAALALVALALLSTLFASNFAVSLREWRVVVVESVVFYFLVRVGFDFSRQPSTPAPHLPRWVWRLIDAFVAGAMLQAFFALYLYFFTDQSIDAEGVHRALGLGYGSPNNLALVLGRAWPVLLVVSLLPGQSNLRRGGYGAGLAAVSLALYLTFSKGALLVGLPVGLVAMALLYGLHRWRQNWRRVAVATLGALGLAALALVPFSQTGRFRNTFDLSEGSTAFFRLKLWESAWAMLRDYWPLGVGLDNFLYQYRTRYILPEAWQEPNLNHPHNLVLDFGTRLGLGGIALLLWLQVIYWRNAGQLYRRQFSPLLLGLMGSMVIFLGHGLVDNAYFLVDLAFAFFLNVGIVQRLSE